MNQDHLTDPQGSATASRPMRFNLINPSDPYTFESDDLEVAAVAVCLLGNGRYPADALGEDANKGNNVPPFLVGGHDEWFQARFGSNYEAVATRCLETRADALARCLESVTLGSKRRTSMNDIGGRARDLARAIREAGQVQQDDANRKLCPVAEAARSDDTKPADTAPPEA